MLTYGHFKSCHYKSSLLKRDEVLIHATCMNMDKSHKLCSKRSKAQKTHILYDSTCMNCPEQANPYRQKADWHLSGAGGREENPGTRQW